MNGDKPLYGGDATGDPEVDALVAAGMPLPAALAASGYGASASESAVDWPHARPLDAGSGWHRHVEALPSLTDVELAALRAAVVAGIEVAGATRRPILALDARANALDIDGSRGFLARLIDAARQGEPLPVIMERVARWVGWSDEDASALAEELTGVVEDAAAVDRSDDPCPAFEPGEPERGGDCATDGHFACDGCVNRASCEGGCGQRPSRCECPVCETCQLRKFQCECGASWAFLPDDGGGQ